LERKAELFCARTKLPHEYLENRDIDLFSIPDRTENDMERYDKELDGRFSFAPRRGRYGKGE
jgi:hypothetical protein